MELYLRTLNGTRPLTLLAGCLLLGIYGSQKTYANPFIMKMKNCFILFSFLFISSIVSAQLTHFGGGVTLANGASYEIDEQVYENSALALHMRAHYKIDKHIYIVPGVSYFFPKTESYAMGGEAKTGLFTIDVDAHYYFAPRKKMSAYLLGGMHMDFWALKDDHKTSYSGAVDVDEIKLAPGVNAGGGLRFKLNNQVAFFTEGRLVISGHSQFMWTNGLIFTLP